MPTPPDQNIPRMQLPPWVPYEERKKRAAGLQQPGFFEAGVAYGAEPERGRVYVVPPFSFSFNFKLGPLQFAQSLSWTGFSLKDLPWAKDISTGLSFLAATLDGAGVALSAAGTAANIDPSRISPTSLAIGDIVVGGLATSVTNLADVFAGNTGLVQTDAGPGLAYGRDSIVSDRNFLLGTAANVVGMIPVPPLAATAGVAGTGVSVSQYAYDLEGMQGKHGGHIVLTGDGTGERAAWEQLRHD